jgi:uncharacterized membrane-anchored protein YhcB (DUF1043 family)
VIALLRFPQVSNPVKEKIILIVIAVVAGVFITSLSLRINQRENQNTTFLLISNGLNAKMNDLDSRVTETETKLGL